MHGACARSPLVAAAAGAEQAVVEWSGGSSGGGGGGRSGLPRLLPRGGQRDGQRVAPYGDDADAARRLHAVVVVKAWYALVPDALAILESVELGRAGD